MNTNFTATFSSTTIEFQNDLPEINFERCFQLIKLEKITQSSDPIDWPNFKTWLSTLIGNEMPLLNLNKFFSSESFTGNEPILFGKILTVSVKKYFSNTVYERFNDVSGLQFYFKVNEKLNKLSPLEKLKVIKNLMNGGSKDLEQFSKLLSTSMVYIPGLKEMGALLFCANIPQKDTVSFMKHLSVTKVGDDEKLKEVTVKDIYYK